MIDHQLVERCRRGDRAAQHEIYALTAERVYHLVLRITRSPEDAFDLAQETYVRAFTRIGQFDGKSSFYTWLCRIAINEALQLLRHQEVAGAHRESLAAGSNDGSNNDGLDAKIDVEGALALLPPVDRAILLLRYQEGLDYETIAQVTDCAIGTIASRLNRARQRMRELLKGGYDSTEEKPPAEHPKDRPESETAGIGRTAPPLQVRPGTET